MATYLLTYLLTYSEMFLGLNVATFITVNVLYGQYRRKPGLNNLGKTFHQCPVT